MREVTEFCKANDPSPPDFVSEMVEDGLIRQECENDRSRMTAHDKKLVSAKLDHFYETHWSSVIMSIMQYKNPLVANAHALTTLSTKVDQSNPVYFHIEWVRPGRHTFVVEHDQGGAILGDDQMYEKRL